MLKKYEMTDERIEREGKLKDFISYIKNYSTREFIYFFSGITIELYKKQLYMPKTELECSVKFPLNIIKHGFINQQVEVILSAWEIQDMAYASIVNSNDYRKEIMRRKDAGVVVNLYRGYANEHSNSDYIKKGKLPDIFKFMMGMTYEQFKYQNLAWTYQSFSRNYHILLGSNKINRDKIVDINTITKKLFALSADEFLINVFYLLWLCSERPDPLGTDEKLYKRRENSILSKENLERIIDYYSVTYDDVRKSPIQKQLFYSKPFVVTQSTFDDFSKEYPNLKIQLFHSGGIFHDRYIILDYGTNDEKIFLCGASSKDAGGRITSILEDPDRKKYEPMIKDLLKNKKLVLK